MVWFLVHISGPIYHKAQLQNGQKTIFQSANCSRQAHFTIAIMQCLNMTSFLFQISEGNEAYLKWIEQSTQK